MKLHRIETLNLNSLYDKQCVDLEATLASASLFLIYGPTGSGKSTLMDAVSLALFGKTPRLNATHGEATTDPRAIMSRGTGCCSATVEFSKIEQGGRQTYRAEWSCQRARKNPEKPLQEAQRSIERLAADGSWELVVSSRRKMDYEPVFDEVLEGFGVGDFNRSMLLAQGQFDAFLGASAQERAQILERLTDTRIYQSLGARAAQLYRRHASRVASLRTLAAAGGGLEADALAQLEATHERNSAALVERRNELEQATRCLAWFDEARVLESKLAEAATELQQVREATELAAGMLGRLADHERCEEGRAFKRLDALRAAEEQVAQLQERQVALDGALPDLDAAAQASRQDALVAASRERLASEHLELLRPRVAEAERAALEHTSAARLAEEAVAQREAAEVRVKEAEQSARAALDTLSAANEAAEQARSELAAHEADRELVNRWGPLRSRLDQLVSSLDDLARDTSTLNAREATFTLDRARLSDERAAHEALRASALEPAQQALQSAERALLERLSLPDFDSSRRQAADAVAAITLAHDTLQRAEAPLAAARSARSKLDEAQAHCDALAAQLDLDREGLEVFSREVTHTAELEAQALHALERTRLLAELALHRGALTDGEACPLCGSPDHPWAHDAERLAQDASVREAVAAAQHAHDDARQAHTTATKQWQQADVATRERVVMLELLREHAAAAAGQQLVLDQAASRSLEACALPPDSTNEDVEAALQHTRAQLIGAEQTLTTLDQTKRAVDESAQQLRRLLDGQQEAEAKLRDREATLLERGRLLGTERTAHTEALRAAEGERDACRSLLQEQGLALEGEDPARWRDLGDERRQQHEGRVKSLAEKEALREQAATARQGTEAMRAERTSQRDALVTRAHQQEAERDEKRSLAERAHDAMRTAWQAAVATDSMRPADALAPENASGAVLLAAQKQWAEETKAAARAAETAHRLALDAYQEAQAQRTTLLGQQSERATARDHARRELDAALQSLDLDGDGALLAIRLDEAELGELREKKRSLADRKLAVEVRIRERREQLAASQAARPVTLADAPSRDELEAEVTAATERHQQATLAHQSTRDQLRDHNHAMHEREQSVSRLRTAEQEAQVWKTLNDYIGVREGGAFREFAQALNLGKLLARANLHLARLSNRYELIPRHAAGLPTLDFDLRDLWQAGQRVAPRSLSGGERFLVSLSLALGLSDFRQVQMPIETLLLDEGFGTLDAETLSVALAALSQLQSDGRQVGIISHVVGLRDRIEARIEVKPLGSGRSKVGIPT